MSRKRTGRLKLPHVDRWGAVQLWPTTIKLRSGKRGSAKRRTGRWLEPFPFAPVIHYSRRSKGRRANGRFA